MSEISNEQLEQMIGTPIQTHGDTKTVEREKNEVNLPATVDDDIVIDADDDVDTDESGEIEYIGESDYKEPADIIWFTLANKAFPTRMVSPFIVMKLAKAQNDQNEQLAMAYTYDLIMAMVPKRYRKRLEDHLTVSEYEDTELNKAMEYVMQQWATFRNNTGPLAKKNASRGQSTQQKERGTSRVISFKEGLKSEKPLTDEQKEELARIQQQTGNKN